MGAVDIRFDQAETWLVRNTFKVPVELVPYILLPHHALDSFSPHAKSGKDDMVMKELEHEIAQVNGQREEIALLDSVEERLARRVEALRKVKSGLSELLIAGGTRGEQPSICDTEIPSKRTMCCHQPRCQIRLKSLQPRSRPM